MLILNMLLSNMLKPNGKISEQLLVHMFAARSNSPAILQCPTKLRCSIVTTHAPLAVQNGWVKKAGSCLELTVTWHADFVSFCPCVALGGLGRYCPVRSMSKSCDSSIAAQLHRCSLCRPSIQPALRVSFLALRFEF